MAKRKFKKGDHVKIYREGVLVAEGIIHGWTYHRATKRYQYLVGMRDNKSRAYFEEASLLHSDETSEGVIY